MTDNNVDAAYPKTTDEIRLLEKTIESLLARIPETWQPLNADDLTATEQRALFLLTAAGLIDRRCRLRFVTLLDSFSAEIEFEATGEYGIVEATQTVVLQMWSKCRDDFDNWIKTHGNAPTVQSELIHQSWRLTDQGVIAREDLKKAGFDRKYVFDYVLRQGVARTRPSCRGRGNLIKMTRLDGSDIKPTPVSITNWDEGAKQFAEEFFKLFGQAMGKPQTIQPDSGWRFEPGEAVYKELRIPIKGAAWFILKKLAENFGRPVLKDTLIALMDEVSDASPETWLRDNLTAARDAVRTALNLDKSVDPIPNVERGRNAAWKLDDKFF